MADTPETPSPDIARALRESGITIEEKTGTREPAVTKKTVVGRVRTYAADMSRVIRARGETLTSIVAAEREAAEKKQESAVKSNSNNRRLMVVSGGLIGLGMVCIAGAILFFTLREEARQEIVMNEGLVRANTALTVSLGEGDSPIELLGTTRDDARITLGDVARIEIRIAGTTLTKETTPSALPLPPALMRETTAAMVGLHAFEGTAPFIILKVTAYDRAYAALLLWERSMAEDLAPFFTPHNKSGAFPPRLTFSDAVVRNIDVRVSEPGLPIVYAFLDRETVVITTSEFTIREILTRLASGQ